MIGVKDGSIGRLPGSLLLGAIIVATGLALALFPLSFLVVVLLGTIVIAWTLTVPHLALYLIAFAIPFGSLFELDVGGITVGVTEGLIGLMLAGWIARAIALREHGWIWPRQSIPIALFIGAALLSLLNATALPFAAKEIVKWVEVLATITFVVNAVSRAQSKGIVAALLLAGVAQSLLGAYQFFTQSGPEFFILRGRYMRAYGTFEQPNPYAGYLGLIAPVALALALSVFERPGSAGQGRGILSLALVLDELRENWLTWLALASLIAVGAGLGMSWSRGAWLGFGAAVVIITLIRSRQSAVFFIAVILFAITIGSLGGARLLPESVVQRLTSFVPFLGVRDVGAVEVNDDNYASVERLAHWQSALDMWRDRPWLGVGFGNYEAAYAEYALPKWPLALGHAHNYYLNIAAETGLVGLLAYLLLWGTTFWHTWQAMHRTTDRYAKALALGALGVLVHVSVHNVVDNLWVHNMYIHVAIVLGLAFANHQDTADISLVPG